MDFIIARGERLTPIEVKWTEHPTPGDARHLLTFLDEHSKRARAGDRGDARGIRQTG